MQHIYSQLGNTAKAMEMSCFANRIGHAYPNPEIQDLAAVDPDKYRGIRHPDYSVKNIDIRYPDLHVRGLWKKIRIGAGKGKATAPASRFGSASCVWAGKGKLSI